MPETKIPALPEPSSVTDPTLRNLLSTIKEALDVRLGRRGDPLDKAITYRDLYESGSVNLNGYPVYVGPKPGNRGSISTVTGTSSGGDSSGGDSSSATVEPIIPPAPTNLTVSASFRAASLEWTDPTYTGHGFTEIWRATSDDLSSAIIVADSAASIGSDVVQFVEGVTYYYWVRFRSITGHTGPYNQTAGTPMTPQRDVGYLVDQLSDSGSADSPFFELTVPTDINGVTVPPGVYFKNTFIHEASIDDAQIKSVSANKINVAQLSAFTANLGTITAGSMTSPDGKVVIDLNSGQFHVKSALSGGRLEIAQNCIKVYDANGILRTKIGDLSA